MGLKVFLTTVMGLFVFSNVYAAALTPEMCKEKVLAAAELLAAEGAAGLEKIKAEDGEFRFGDGKGYVWVHNLDGFMVMHPMKPSLDGKSLMDMRDVNGIYLFVAFNEVAEDQGEGWVPYSWPKPGVAESSPKVSYVKLVETDDDEYVVGAGMYDVTADDVHKLFPNDFVYEH